MTGKTYSNVIQFIENIENNNLSGGLFYYEKSTNTINFGYGINLTSLVTQNGNGTYSVPTWLGSILQSQLGINLTPSQLAAIATPNPQIGPGTAANITTTASSSTQQAAADNAAQAFFKQDVVAPLTTLFGTNSSGNSIFTGLPSNVQFGLEDAYYNGARTVGQNLQGYIKNKDYLNAALELANGTPTMAPNRSLFDALQILGSNPAIDGSNNIVGVSINGQAVSGHVQGIDESDIAGSIFINYSDTDDNVGIDYNPAASTAILNNGSVSLNVGALIPSNLSFSNGTFTGQIGSGSTSFPVAVQQNLITISGPGGTNVTLTSSDSTVSPDGNGGLVIMGPNGASGPQVVVAADGSSTVYASDGSISATLPSGTRFGQASDGSLLAAIPSDSGPGIYAVQEFGADGSPGQISTAGPAPSSLLQLASLVTPAPGGTDQFNFTTPGENGQPASQEDYVVNGSWSAAGSQFVAVTNVSTNVQSLISNSGGVPSVIETISQIDHGTYFVAGSNTSTSSFTLAGLTSAPSFTNSGTLTVATAAGTYHIDRVTGDITDLGAVTATIGDQTVTLLGLGGSSPFAVVSTPGTTTAGASSSTVLAYPQGPAARTAGRSHRRWVGFLGISHDRGSARTDGGASLWGFMRRDGHSGGPRRCRLVVRVRSSGRSVGGFGGAGGRSSLTGAAESAFAANSGCTRWLPVTNGPGRMTSLQGGTTHGRIHDVSLGFGGLG